MTDVEKAFNERLLKRIWKAVSGEVEHSTVFVEVTPGRLLVRSVRGRKQIKFRVSSQKVVENFTSGFDGNKIII